MTRFNPRRISAPVAAALVCVALALLSFVALVAYDGAGPIAFWQ
jgi:hypothetical protein